MKLPFLSMLMEILDRLDGFSGILKRIWLFLSLPFVALFSGLYAGLSEAGRIFAQGPFRALFGILLFPLLFIFRLTSDARKDLLWCLPAIIAGFCIAMLAISTIAQGERIQQRYRMNAATAIRNGEFERALVFSQRVLTESGEVNEADQLRLAMCLIQTGETTLATQIIDDLAPDDRQGYPPAHRLKALNLTLAVEKTKNLALAESLRFHLSNSDDTKSEAIQTAFAVYYMVTQQVDRAIQFLESAAEANPMHYHTIASIYGERNEEVRKIDALRRAKICYEDLLTDDPASETNRIALAKTLTRLELYPEAEKLLLEGLDINSTDQMKRSLAEYCLLRHDLSDDFDEKLLYLQRSIDFDINFLPAYQALFRQFKLRLADASDKADQLEDVLRANLASGNNTALSHFAMSNIKSKRGEKKLALFHIEKAFQLDPRFAVVANNLAWILANDEENKDLERAYELSKDVVEHFPRNPLFRDTYATVLMEQEKYQEALVEFEKALATIKGKKNVHTKLAFIYGELGMVDMKEVHLRKAATASTPR